MLAMHQLGSPVSNVTVLSFFFPLLLLLLGFSFAKGETNRLQNKSRNLVADPATTTATDKIW